MAAESPKIKLYTNHGCPWAHRAHSALSELNVPYDEEIVDLSVPRTQEYLKVNPRGLVPSLSYNGEIITESAIVVSFLADAIPSTLVPKSTDPNGPLVRARIAFFVDTYFSKAGGHYFKTLSGKTEEERSIATTDLVNAIVKEVDPLLADAGPFFGGSAKLTLAEVLTGSFVLRLYSLPKYGVLSETLLSELSAKAPNFDKWAKEVVKHPSVTAGIWDEEKVGVRTKERYEKLRAQA